MNEDITNRNIVRISSDSNYNSKKCCHCVFTCCKKNKTETQIKKQQTTLSDINNILTCKKDLLKLDKVFSISKLSSNYLSAQNNLSSNNQIKTVSRKKEIDTTSSNTKKFFHEFKDKLRCFFCGGRKCKHENFKNNLHYNNAIYGLNSNFITSDVIASQRPSEILITKYNLLSTFKEYNIGLIVNLQREGEHPYCGPNAALTSAGYSYNPSVFSGDDIKCKLSGWKDMSVPSSMNFMLDIVKSMSEVVIDFHKKVLVHCHAGYGRTGVVIACYMLFNSEKNSDEIISEIRTKRKKCIETKDQKHYCKKFEDFLMHTRILFGAKESIDVYLKRQEDLLFGEESRKYGYIPKLITCILEKIIEIKEKNNLENLLIYKILQGLLLDWNDEFESVLTLLKATLNRNNWMLFNETENLMILSELLFDWIEDCVEYLISPERTETILSNELFLSFQFKDKANKNKAQELVTYIKKIYHCYEYEILYQFASFFALIQPTNENENFVFTEMLDRISLELLGFNLSEINNDMNYMKSTKPLVTGLSSILRLIFNFLVNKETEITASPKRRHSNFLQPNYTFSQRVMDLQKNKSTIQPNNSHVNNHHTKSLFKDKSEFSDPKEKKLYQMYSLLTRYFNRDPQNRNSDQFKNQLHPNEVSNNMHNSNFLQSTNISKQNKKLAKIIEEVLAKHPQSSSYSDISRDNNSNIEICNNSSQINLNKLNIEESFKSSERSKENQILNKLNNVNKNNKEMLPMFVRRNKQFMTCNMKNKNEGDINPCRLLMFETFQKSLIESKKNQPDTKFNTLLHQQRVSLFQRQEGDFSQIQKKLSKGECLKEIKNYEKNHYFSKGNTKIRNMGIPRINSIKKEINKFTSDSQIYHLKLRNNFLNNPDIIKNKFKIGDV